MLFAGIDLGWQSQPSGVALLDGEGDVIGTDRLATPADVLTWLEGQVGTAPAMVAVDAPLLIRNETGMRPVDRLMHVHFGRYDAGCYPANLRLPFAARVTALSDALAQRGFQHAPAIAPQVAGRFQIEVYPHAALVSLFALDRILKYKRGLVAERRRELNRLRRLLATKVRGQMPSVPRIGALKPVEDKLDAVLAAYVGLLWWQRGTAACHCFGDGETGYIVVPHRAS